MAENINALILPIGADPSQFEKSIKEVKDGIKTLKAQIEGTPFNLVTPQLKKELKDLENTYATLKTSVQNTGAALNNSVGATKNARTALNSLSLVAQDAPFGFIGIQNNLPGVIQSFGQLTSQSGGLKGALSEIGKSLVGPAGLFLAFSAVTAAVTFAVQKYGSLGAAYEALTGKTNKYADAIKKAEDAQKEFVKSSSTIAELQNQASGSYETASIKLQALSAIVLDETKSQKLRKNALEQLKDLDKERFKNFDLEKTSLAGLSTAVDNYTNSLIANAVAKQYESEIAKTTINLNTQRDALFNLQKQLDDINSRYPDLAKNADEYNKSTKRFTIPKDVEDYNNLIKKIQQQEAVVTQVEFPRFEELKKKFEDAIGDLNNYYNIGGKGGKGGKAGNALKVALDTQDLDAAFNLSKIKSSVEKFGNVLLDSNNSIEERKNALKELVAVNPQVFNGLTLEKSGLLANKETIEEYIRSLEVLIQSRKDDTRASEINTQFRNAELKKQDEAIKLDNDRAESIAKTTTAQDFFIKSLSEFLQKNNSLIAQQKEIQEINQGVIDILTKGLGVENVYEKAIKDLLNFESYQKATSDRIAKNFRFLQNPLEDLFGSVLEDGIANWQAFGDAVVSEIKKIAAALLAKSFITLLGNLLAPGAGSLLSGAFSGISDEGLGNWLDIFDPQGSKVNFAGVQGGGMQMAGSVNLSLRGSDLVGSINRTNSTINRVG